MSDTGKKPRRRKIRYFSKPHPPSKMSMASFACLAIHCAALYYLARLIGTKIWFLEYESYSFVVSHIYGLVQFLYRASLVWLAASGVRGILDALRRKSASAGRRAAMNEAPGDAAEPPQILFRDRLLSFSLWLLDAAYAAAMLFFIGRYAWLCCTEYSPVSFYQSSSTVTVYGNNFYPPSTLVIMGAVGVFATIAPPLFRRLTRKMPIRLSCVPILENLYQAVGLACLIGAVHVIGSVFYVNYVFQCKVGLLLAALYFSISVLRGMILDGIHGDLTGSFSHRPALSLLERFRLFDASLTFSERTGLSLKSLWSIRYALSLVPSMALFGAVLLLGMTCLYTIDPGQEALLYRFGVLRSDSVKTPGLHFRLPWPIDRIALYNVDGIKTLLVGYTPSESRDYLWTSEHGGEENTLLLGGGNELIAVNLRVAYTISDVKAYATTNADPRSVMTSNIYDILMQKTMSSDLDTVLNIDRRELSDDLRDQMNAFIKANNIGVSVEQIIVESIHPPIQLADVYQGVVSASIQKETIITNAQADSEKKVIDSAWQKESSILKASKSQIEKLSQIRRDMAVYNNAYLAHEISPDCYELLKVLNAYQTAISNQRVYALSPGAMAHLDRYTFTNGLPVIWAE
ncbi:MAG: hypothetical protein LBS72_08440 [Oscillospiraceae bacterium]|jgi:regulator of protease activity HflC (stomatin/prohibitin superfamily)|nr:hypothetical protein [Oscillospiraceae bacterium]